MASWRRVACPLLYAAPWQHNRKQKARGEEVDSVIESAVPPVTTRLPRALVLTLSNQNHIREAPWNLQMQ